MVSLVSGSETRLTAVSHTCALVVEYLQKQVREEIEAPKDVFLTKDDKVDIMRSIYSVGAVQFLAIGGSVLLIVSYMLK